jgi:uncharacterized membrane protein
MISFQKIGSLFYGIGIIVYGIQQIIICDFRPQILPDFPKWAHTFIIFPIITGIAMIIMGLVISGIIKAKEDIKKRASLYLGFYFLALIFLSHIPYLLFVYPHKLSHLGSWGDALKELAFSGGSFIIANSFSHRLFSFTKYNSFNHALEKLVPLGRIFYCTTIILFGCNHFAYDLSGMVPKWLCISVFWSYFGGTALIMAGTAILFKVWLQPIAFLLALMLFLWFIILHLPNAIADPYSGRGNAIVSAFDALLFSGVALVLADTKIKTNTKNEV